MRALCNARFSFATIVFVLLALTDMSFAQQKEAPAAKSETARKAANQPDTSMADQEKAQTTAPQKTGGTPSGPRESITVHGDWTIVVHNKDGSVASRHQFRNSLKGAKALAWVFGRAVTVTGWQIDILDDLCNPQCVLVQGSGNMPGLFYGLTVTVPASGPNANKLVLAGSVTISTSGQITKVDTMMRDCATPQYHYGGTLCDTAPEMTLASPPPINVQAGQKVDLTVVLDFS